MMRRLFLFVLSACLLSLLSACGSQEQLPEDSPPADETIVLTVWGAEEDQVLLEQIFASFQAHYAGQADFRITYQPQSESNCKDVLLGDLEGGADVFAFADDQVSALAAAGGLDPITDGAAIQSASLPAAVEAASVENTLYAYPLTADNGYFLYYNKSYFTEADVQRLDRILETAAQAGRLVAMDWSSAWYVYAFFGNTGLEVGLNEDGLTNYCTWNSTDGPIRGVDVAQAMLDVAASPAFSNRTDTAFLSGVQDGSVIAGVSGVWNAVAVKEAWGDDMGAAKLPTYTCAGQQLLAAGPGSGQRQRRQLPGGSGVSGHRGSAGAVQLFPAPAGGRKVLGPCGRIFRQHGPGEPLRRVPSGSAGPAGRGRKRAVTQNRYGRKWYERQADTTAAPGPAHCSAGPDRAVIQHFGGIQHQQCPRQRGDHCG